MIRKERIMTTTQLFRTRGPDLVIGGVCGGLARYFDLDVSLVRLFFLLLLLSGGGVLIYLLLWIISAGAAEIADRARAFGSDPSGALRSASPQTALFAGVALILLGLSFLIQNLQISWLAWLNLGTLWPLLLVVAGVVMLARRRGGVTR
jgi:phage shock protein C